MTSLTTARSFVLGSANAERLEELFGLLDSSSTSSRSILTNLLVDLHVVLVFGLNTRDLFSGHVEEFDWQDTAAKKLVVLGRLEHHIVLPSCFYVSIITEGRTIVNRNYR